MRKYVYLLAAMVVLSLVALAQDQAKTTTLDGVIMDKACSARHLKAADPQQSAANAPTDCAKKEPCFKSGLGLFTGGKFIPFDEAGSAKAKAALDKTTKEKGATFKVTGKLADGKMTVDSITEI